MFLKKSVVTAALIACGALAVNANAATSPQTSTFQVTATVISSCSVTTSPIAFGNYDPTSTTALTAQGAVNAKCTKGSVVAVALDQGTHPVTGTSTAAIPARQMSNGTVTLPYHIYTTSGGTTEWGNTTAQEPATQTSATVNTALVFTTYGNLPAGADVTAGAYTDTVTASLTF
jgi:spore coat protein U-like protein